MIANSVLQMAFYLAALLLLAKPLGSYMARVYEGRPVILARIGAPLERLIYRVCGIDPLKEMRWTQYALAVIWFSALSVLVVYLLQRVQGWLPLDPMKTAAVSPGSSFNTAVSFATNTNWQGYSGETTMSDLTQMLALTVQNFVSAAAGMAVLIALIRGITRQAAQTIGNFWVDLTRGTLYILLPLSFLLALALVSQGVVQSLSAYPTVPLLQPVQYETTHDRAAQPSKDHHGQPAKQKALQKDQVLALGPVASQEAIKQLGTNGGGFFNVNSAHPFENPTPLSNFLEMLAILLIPAALCYTFGRMVGDTRQGWAILAAMTIVFVASLTVCFAAEQAGNPLLAKAGANETPSVLQAGGNMEGKEVRFGVVGSALWTTATTAASNGSVNSMLDSYMPLGGLVPMSLMQVGEVIYGGVGSGLYGMLLLVIVAVFIAGLMIGRTPEYLGKKIEAFDIKMASIGVLVPFFVVLGGTALAVMLPAGRAGPANPGAHGFSEILYAFSSAGNNNGSAFAGLSADTPFYNTALAVAMWCARFWVMIPTLALAGALAGKKKVPAGAGTLATHTPLFVFFLLGVVVVIGALTFFPALALGPIVEHLLLYGAH